MGTMYSKAELLKICEEKKILLEERAKKRDVLNEELRKEHFEKRTRWVALAKSCFDKYRESKKVATSNFLGVRSSIKIDVPEVFYNEMEDALSPGVVEYVESVTNVPRVTRYCCWKMWEESAQCVPEMEHLGKMTAAEMLEFFRLHIVSVYSGNGLIELNPAVISALFTVDHIWDTQVEYCNRSTMIY